MTTAASTAATTTGAAAKGGVLNYAEAGDFNDFNPWGFGAVNFEMYDQVFSRLLWKDGTGKANPDLGESWDMAADNHSFTVKLRKNAKWQDGKPVTAGDFVTMYGYLKDPVISKYTGAQKMAGLFETIVGPLQSDSAYKVELNENSGSIFNGLVNMHKPPFDQKQVRQALSYSLDREGMVKSAFFGVSHPITLVVPGMNFFADGLQDAIDPQRIRRAR